MPDVGLDRLTEEVAAESALDVFSRRSVRHGGRVWTVDGVHGGSGVRLYRVVADAHWRPAKDGGPDHRVPVRLT